MHILQSSLRLEQAGMAPTWKTTDDYIVKRPTMKSRQFDMMQCRGNQNEFENWIKQRYSDHETQLARNGSKANNQLSIRILLQEYPDRANDEQWSQTWICICNLLLVKRLACNGYGIIFYPLGICSDRISNLQNCPVCEKAPKPRQTTSPVSRQDIILKLLNTKQAVKTSTKHQVAKQIIFAY